MNASFPYVMAVAVADRVTAAGVSTSEDKVGAVYHLVLGRDPDEEERRLGLSFLEASSDALVQLAQALLMTNEFVFVD